MSVECPEVDEYRSNPWGMCSGNSDGFGCGGYVDFTPKILADAAIAALETLVARRDRMYRDERLLRQKAESALTEAIRHPNGKLGRISEYVYRIEHVRAEEDQHG